MAEKLSVEIEADVKDALKEIKALREQVEALGDTAEKTAKSNEEISKSSKGLGKAFNGLKGLLKGAFGLGIVLALFEKLKEAFMQNQTTADAFAKVGVVLQGIFNALIQVAEPLVEILANMFTKPKETLEGFKEKFEQLGSFIRDQFLDRIINSLQTKLTEVSLAFAKIAKLFNKFTGDKEGEAEAEARILELQEKKNQLQLEQLARNERIKDVVENIKEGVKETVKGFVEQVKKTAENAELLALAEDRVAKMEIAQQGLVEAYDLQAEKLRQIRDDEFKSLESRKKANDDLLGVLEEQAAAEKKTIDERIALLQLQQRTLGFQRERENEILALKNELVAVEAKVTGFKSEQLINDIALKREADEINEIKSRGLLEISQLEKDGLEEREQNELRKLQMALDRIDAEKQAEVDLLVAKQANYDKDSVAYQDYQAQINMIEAESAEKKKAIDMAVNQQKLDSTLGLLGALKGAFSENAKVVKALGIGEALINTYTGATKALAAPFPMNLVQLATTLTAGFAQVKSIMAVDTDAGSSGGGASAAAAPSVPSMPNVSIAGGNVGTGNQLLGAIGDQLQKPQRSYVVSTDVSSQQAMDRRIVQNATFG